MMRTMLAATLSVLILCMHAAAQEIPLVMENTLLLMTATGSWDLMPVSEEEDYLIAQVQGGALWYRISSESIWHCTVSVADLKGLFVDDTYATFACVAGSGNAVLRLPLPWTGSADTMLAWPDVSYDNQGYYYYEYNHVSMLRLYPKPPLPSSHIFVWGTRSWHYVSQYGSGSGGEERLARLMAPQYICTNYLLDMASRPLQYAAYPVTATGFLRGGVRWHHSNAIGWQYDIGFMHYEQASHDSLQAVCSGTVDYPVIGPTFIDDKGIVFARTGMTDSLRLVALAKLPGGRSDSIFAVRPYHNGLVWAAPGDYTALFAADIFYDVPGDEILGLLPRTRQFGVYNANLGMFLGTTTPFEGDSLDVKIISPQVSQSLRLAVRDGNQVRLYRFGVPTAAEPRQPRSIQSDDTHITASPQPAHESVRFTFSGDMNLAREIILYDLLGREVNHLVLNPQQTSAVFSTSSLPSGIYFATVRGSISSRPHKFVVLH